MLTVYNEMKAIGKGSAMREQVKGPEGGMPRNNVMDVADVVAWEKEIAAAGTSLAELMVRAGQAVANYANDLLFEDDPLQPFNDKFVIPNVVDARKSAHKIVVLCGSGNNGGDGWVAAEELGAQGFEVVLVTKVPATEIVAEPARTNALKAAAEGSFEVAIDPDAEDLAMLLDASDLVIDAILGTGFAHDAVREPYSTWIKLANTAREERGPSDSLDCSNADREDCGSDDLLARSADGLGAGHSTKILAVDCPSGLNAQTGEPASDCIKADLTVTMLAIKTGLVAPSAVPYVGDLHLDQLGVSPLC